MAYTSTDLLNIDTAISRLIAGDRIVRVTRDGRTVEYSQASLAELQAIRTTILNEINRAAQSTTVENPRTVTILTRKGL
jgi:hypothetical protein